MPSKNPFETEIKLNNLIDKNDVININYISLFIWFILSMILAMIITLIPAQLCHNAVCHVIGFLFVLSIMFNPMIILLVYMCILDKIVYIR